MNAHDLVIVHDRQRQRGWHLSWKCGTKGCDARGNTTTPNRDKAIALFTLIAEGHKRSEAQA